MATKFNFGGKFLYFLIFSVFWLNIILGAEEKYSLYSKTTSPVKILTKVITPLMYKANKFWYWFEVYELLIGVVQENFGLSQIKPPHLGLQYILQITVKLEFGLAFPILKQGFISFHKQFFSFVSKKRHLNFNRWRFYLFY